MCGALHLKKGGYCTYFLPFINVSIENNIYKGKGKKRAICMRYFIGNDVLFYRHHVHQFIQNKRNTIINQI